ncbi:hypothetical protein Pedsa_0523 [Pseudopedobacter saltans DSM 12145]|uniref:Uncharacterized protein n=1 Tax=Pseudopedobacter saltans (strain ATCC 51119 / DSM 12145 / JCM 21818 / CCUG 39354 / LMG 10337 / NBRC 100064 / NCIMB 13643) TaxID=762903 RepID=F0S6M8_PSESL|nr:hypothetical protein [Pseudopedobacter saltans]ADY51104.1 hypothetical protein Pedsa_0523 [Pseudopedobacter saltans DSM 12145]
MGEQTGLISYSGKLGNTVGVRKKGGNFVRTVPKSVNMSENSFKSAKEFGYGSTACALIKTAFDPLMLRPFKGTLHNRLSEVMRKVIRSGPITMKGNRNVFDGDLSLLKGFEFNDKVRLNSFFRTLPEVGLVDKELRLSLPKFIWEELLTKVPAKANYVVLGFGFGFLDFKNYTYQLELAPELRIGKEEHFSGASLSFPVPDTEEQAVLVMMNVFFESATEKYRSKIDNQLYQGGAFLEAIHLLGGEVVTFENEEPHEVSEEDKPVGSLVWKML